MSSPGSSAGKETACNAGDLGSIPGSERSPGERIGYPLQYSQASLVARMVKNLPAMRETWVQEYSSILAWRIPNEQRSLVGYSPRGHKESDTTERRSTVQHITKYALQASPTLPHLFLTPTL